MKIKKATHNKIQKHILKDFPLEACGVITTNGDYIPCKNLADHPERQFKIDQNIINDHYINKTIAAIVHSHIILPDVSQSRTDPRTPSHADQVSWIASNVPWLIYATNGTEVTEPLILDDAEIAPLVGREFVHGLYDCLSIVRDWHRLNGMYFDNAPRAWKWWEHNQNLYEDNYRSYGFIDVVDHADLKIGDVVLMKIAGDVVNHAAVITGDNEILHHCQHRLSGHDTLSKWHKQIHKIVRYNK